MWIIKNNAQWNFRKKGAHREHYAVERGCCYNPATSMLCQNTLLKDESVSLLFKYPNWWCSFPRITNQLKFSLLCPFNASESNLIILGLTGCIINHTAARFYTALTWEKMNKKGQTYHDQTCSWLWHHILGMYAMCFWCSMCDKLICARTAPSG